MEAGDPPVAARAALTFAYFWYSFMPLARGTAAVGYVALLGLFLAAGMPISTPIPKVWQYLLIPRVRHHSPGPGQPLSDAELVALCVSLFLVACFCGRLGGG
jgi:hypothetical protein